MPFFAPLPGTTRTQGTSTREQPYQRAYRYGIGMLCTGALLNWLGFAQHYFEPIRYIGVVCVLAGAFCICSAMCRWLGKPILGGLQQNAQSGTGPDREVAIFAVPMYRPTNQDGNAPAPMLKPPEYDVVAGSSPPSYEEAIQLNPAYLPNTVQTDSLMGVSTLTEPSGTRTSEGAENMGNPSDNTTSSQNQLNNNNDDNNNLPPPYESVADPLPPIVPVHNSPQNQASQPPHYQWTR